MRMSEVESVDLFTVTLVPEGTDRMSFPSTFSRASILLRETFLTVSVLQSSNIMGLAESECEHIGVTAIHDIFGEIIGPPAESEYAVDPVGVAMTSPLP